MKSFFIILCLISFIQVTYAGSYVKGYYRSDGTYVAPYYRQDSYKQTIKKYKISTYNPNSGTIKKKGKRSKF